MICVDNNFLVILIYPNAAAARTDPNTKMPITRLAERLELFKQEIKDNDETILIPTPVLSEFMQFARDERNKYLKHFKTSPYYRLQAFDTAEAVELAEMYLGDNGRLGQSALKAFAGVDTKTRLRVDRQIVAVAKAHDVSAIYSDDDGVKAFADLFNIPVVRSYELPLPPEPEPNPQPELFEGQEPKPDPDNEVEES